MLFRSQALAWLREVVKQFTGQFNDMDGKERAALRTGLAHWQTNADLASIRDPKELAQLPPAERAAWQQLWADVAALLKKAN